MLVCVVALASNAPAIQFVFQGHRVTDPRDSIVLTVSMDEYWVDNSDRRHCAVNSDSCLSYRAHVSDISGRSTGSPTGWHEVSYLPLNENSTVAFWIETDRFTADYLRGFTEIRQFDSSGAEIGSGLGGLFIGMGSMDGIWLEGTRIIDVPSISQFAEPPTSRTEFVPGVMGEVVVAVRWRIDSFQRMVNKVGRTRSYLAARPWSTIGSRTSADRAGKTWDRMVQTAGDSMVLRAAEMIAECTPFSRLTTSARRSRSLAIVIPQHTAQPLARCEVTGGTTYFLTPLNDPIRQTLVIAFSVVMGQELANRLTQGAFPE